MKCKLTSNKLLDMINSLTDSERKLFCLYEDLAELTDRLVEVERGIMEGKFWLNYFEEMVLRTDQILKALDSAKEVRDQYNSDLKAKEREIIDLERNISASRLIVVKFLSRYSLEYDQAAEVILLAGQSESPSQIISDECSRIYEFCQWVWNGFILKDAEKKVSFVISDDELPFKKLQ